jgi:HK97 family phage prohead protease
VTLIPVDSLLKTVEGDPDLFQFRFDFTLEGKALDGGGTQATVTELEDGDLIIEGYAAVFDGTDRQGENFAPGAFQRGIKGFLEGQSGLCYHHKFDKCMGKVLSLEEVEGKGLKMRARVDGATRTHPELGTYYQQIKKGTLNALSVGGFFKRAIIDGHQKIVDMDFTEVSVTPVPVHPGTHFSVLAGKALSSDLESKHVVIPAFPEDEIREEDFMWAQESIATLDRIFERLAQRNSGTSTNDRTTTL